MDVRKTKSEELGDEIIGGHPREQETRSTGGTRKGQPTKKIKR